MSRATNLPVDIISVAEGVRDQLEQLQATEAEENKGINASVDAKREANVRRDAKKKQSRRLALRRGRASTILTGGVGLAGNPLGGSSQAAPAEFSRGQSALFG